MTSNDTVINSLKSEIRRLEDEKRMIDDKISAIATTLRHFESQGNGAQNQSPSFFAEEDGLASPSSVKDTIYEILRDESPLHRKDIYERLLQRGVHIGGKMPVNTVGSHLSNDDRFESLGNGVWDIAGVSRNGFDIGIDNECEDDTIDVPW